MYDKLISCEISEYGTALSSSGPLTNRLHLRGTRLSSNGGYRLMLRRLFNQNLICAALSLTLAGPALTSPALAQSKEVITFAAVIFTEAGRGDRMRAIVDTFNKSQDKIEV